MAGDRSYRRRYRISLAAGVVVVLALQVALLAWGGTDESRSDGGRATTHLAQLPESDAPLADVGEALKPEPAGEATLRRSREAILAAMPTIPDLTASLAGAVAPVLYTETIDEPGAEANPAVTYATVSDFLVSPTPDPQPLRPIDDRPVAVLATIGGSARGIGVGAGGPNCKPPRPPPFRRSAVVAGVPSPLVPRI